MFINRRDRIAAIAATVIGLTAAGTVAASAMSSVAVPTPTNGAIYGCVSNSSKMANRTLTGVQFSAKAFQNEGGCPSGTSAIAFNGTGPKGATGAAGTTGGSGISYVATHLEFVGPATIPTGGSFMTNSVRLDSDPGITLPAGTYLATLNAQATPRASGDTAQINPQFFVYSQLKNAAFTGDIFNVGAGALEPDGTNHDSYYSGSATFTIEQTTSLHVYAFGYDSDEGAGAYTLDHLTLTFVQETTSNSITPAAGK